MKTAIIVTLALMAAPTWGSNARADRNMAAMQQRTYRQQSFNAWFAANSRRLAAEQREARMYPYSTATQNSRTGYILRVNQQRREQINRFWNR